MFVVHPWHHSFQRIRIRCGAMTRLFIVEDHEFVRSSLNAIIERETDMYVSGEADSGEAALASFERADADLILIDVSLPGMSGIDLVDRLRKLYPDLPCLMLSGHGERGYVEKAFKAGAGGYVVKQDSEDLLGGIRKVVAGERFLSRELADRDWANFVPH